MKGYQMKFQNSKRTTDLTEAAAIQVLAAHWPNEDDDESPVEVLEQLSSGESIETTDFSLYRIENPVNAPLGGLRFPEGSGLRYDRAMMEKDSEQ